MDRVLPLEKSITTGNILFALNFKDNNNNNVIIIIIASTNAIWTLFPTHQWQKERAEFIELKKLDELSFLIILKYIYYMCL